MARPAVRVDELHDVAQMSFEELRTYLEHGEPEDLDAYSPVSRVWPMGFAWSSYRKRKRNFAQTKRFVSPSQERAGVGR